MHLALLLLVAAVTGNTEKAIFKAPASNDGDASLTQYASLRLMPDATRIGRLTTRWQTPWPSPEAPGARWSEQLVVLEGLEPDWHYEVRLCWPATMPTTFELKIMEEEDVADLLSRWRLDMLPTAKPNATHEAAMRLLPRRFMLLRAHPSFVVPNVQAEAQETPQVRFELILDPLAFGVLPKSLLPIVGLLVLAIVIAVEDVLPLVYGRLEEVVHGRRQKMVRIKSQ